MISATQKAHIRPIHPFPARMAPSIVWDALPETGDSLNILDPMAGSGTTLVCARLRGHRAVGCDTDPLALLIARAWCANVKPEGLKHRAATVLERARTLSDEVTVEESYPNNTDDETRRFIDFWFDSRNRRELCALSRSISMVRSQNERTLLWCAFSRMIITKTSGASLAMDVSHSRPHRVYDVAPVKPFDTFTKCVSTLAARCPFQPMKSGAPPAQIRYGDARILPIKSKSMDMVITSPPYLNAIDYLRGHKLSLVWMGYNISQIRAIRADNIGAEVSRASSSGEAVCAIMKKAMADLESLDNRRLGMVMHYAYDMDKVMKECSRVLKRKGRAVFVVGDSAICGVFIKNSEALIRLGDRNGLSLISHNTRTIETSRRYLPPPQYAKAGCKMQARMGEEVVLEFCIE